MASPGSKPWVWIVAVAVVVGAATFGVLRQRRAPELPVLGELPPFSLTSQDAQPFGAEQLRGRVWVANFIFTRCPTICPAFTRKMAALQEEAKGVDPLHLVSFSVDPEYDTPEVLRAYMEKYGADPRRWTFLTGDPEAIKATVVGGLKTAMGRDENAPADDLNAIFHGTHFVLVDDQLRIRGYYRSEDPAAVDALVRDMKALARSDR